MWMSCFVIIGARALSIIRFVLLAHQRFNHVKMPISIVIWDAKQYPND